MTASTIIKHYTDGSITLTDGAAHSITVPLGEGDVKVDGLRPDQKDVKAYLVRGVLTTLRKGDDTFVTFSFSAAQADLSSATDDTLLDFMLFRNKYSGNTSTSVDLGDVDTVNVVFTIEATALDGGDHTITLADWAPEAAFSEGEPNTITGSGTVYGAVAMT